jgi:hypothetical protein
MVLFWHRQCRNADSIGQKAPVLEPYQHPHPPFLLHIYIQITVRGKCLLRTTICVCSQDLQEGPRSGTEGIGSNPPKTHFGWSTEIYRYAHRYSGAVCKPINVFSVNHTTARFYLPLGGDIMSLRTCFANGDYSNA